MINELLKDFRKTKLTSEDLNLYKITLNKTYSNSLEKADVFLKSKIAYSNNEATKEELDQNKAVYKIAKKELKEVQSTSAFLANFKNAKHLLRKAEKSKDFKFQEEAVIEFKEAKKLLTEFKFVAREYGRGASLEKNSEYAIEVSNLKFRYNPEYPLALNDVSFKIPAGEYIAIVGHNGSGKSTLSKVLIGVLNPEAGSYKIFGNTIAPSNLDQARKFLGIVFQNPDNQFIGSTVQADIAFGLENKRVEPAKMPDMIHKAAKAVRMEEFLDHEPLNLSGGQKQRVAIASALALNPDILIFDEATSMLDPRGKREIKEIMVNLRKKQNKTILSITHDMDEILNADKVIVMNAGQMVRMGTPEEVLKDKDFLRSIQLDIPFVGLVEEALNEVGVKIGHTNNMDELVEQICK